MIRSAPETGAAGGEVRRLPRRPWLLPVVAVLLSLALLEAAVRLAGFERTYSEKTQGLYRTYYGKTETSWYHTYPPGESGSGRTSEFAFPYRTNSLGFKERELVGSEGAGTFLVLALGDSFTEGVGAPPEDSWPRQLERLIRRERGGTYAVYNAGVSGSDPFFAHVLLRDRLLALKPDLVVIAVNGSDLDDYLFRGGAERFLPDGGVRYRPAPAVEPLYHFSHLGRLLLRLCGYQHTLLRTREVLEQYGEAAQRIGDELARCRDLCARQGARLLVVVHALPHHLSAPAAPPPAAADTPPRPRSLLKRAVRALGLGPGLAHAPHLAAIVARMRREGVPCVDLSPPLRQALEAGPADAYRWPVDGHFTARGYELFAQSLFDALSGESAGLLQP